MIVTIASIQGQALKSRLAANLAVLRARSGRRICIVDADPRAGAYDWCCERGAAGQGPSVPARKLSGLPVPQVIDRLSGAYHDLLIHTGDRDTQETRSALIAARVVVVPVDAAHLDVDAHYPLIARLNSARMFNPELKVLFVLVACGPAPSELELAKARLYVAHVMSASLATAVIHDPCANEYGRGRCVCDAETCDPDAAAGLHALYRELYSH